MSLLKGWVQTSLNTIDYTGAAAGVSAEVMAAVVVARGVAAGVAPAH